MMISVFSCPNYCDFYENQGAGSPSPDVAVLRLSQDKYSIHQFKWVEHPYCLPKGSNAFAHTIPFVTEQCTCSLTSVVAFLGTVLSLISKEEDDDAEGSADRSNRIRSKIMAAARMRLAFSSMR